MSEGMPMPNKTIYVSDADLPIFEKAQQLAGGNLSATIAQALRRFVESREVRSEGFHEITVKVGSVAYTRKRFLGRLIAKGRVNTSGGRREALEVYQTAKGKLVLYIKDVPNWYYGSSRRDYDEAEWSVWSGGGAYRLEVFERLEELKEHIPEELYQAVEQGLSDSQGEFLDI